MSHITWSIEKDGRCPKCKSVPVLIHAPALWGVDPDDVGPDRFDEAEVDEGVTAHYCKTCCVLTSLSLNT